MKIYKKTIVKPLLTTFISLFFAIPFINATSITVQSPIQDTQPQTWVTVFVHGIMSIQPHLTLHNIARFVRDDVQDTTYSKTVEYMRQDPYFYLNQAMQGFGLSKIDLGDITPGNASSAVARLYNYTTHVVTPNTDNHYYTFGWSGLLSPSSRYQESIKLLQQLTHELKENFWKHNIFPKIRLIGYSHGGNVCLNIAAAKNNTDPDSLLSIDELILVGVPIQTETDYLATDDIFKKIYHVFSRADRIQRIDFFSFNRIFSRRYFRGGRRFKVPKKLMQIEFKINRRHKRKHRKNNPNLSHADLNLQNKTVISGRSDQFTNCSPGHLEFWFLGWSPKHYRGDFALRPLPVFVLLPYIIHCINQQKESFVTPAPIIADIRPEFHTLIIKQRKNNYHNEVFPFLSAAQLNDLKFIANEVAVDSSFEDHYHDHIQAAFDKAKTYYQTYDYKKSRDGSYKRNRRMRKRNLTEKQ